MKRDETKYFPATDGHYARHVPAIAKRKETFAGLLRFVSAGAKPPRAWLISIPGDPVVRMECLPESDIPGQLIDLGYKLSREDDGERILPAAIEERFARLADGTLAPLVLGSTQPVAEVRRHAGVTRTARWRFAI